MQLHGTFDEATDAETLVEALADGFGHDDGPRGGTRCGGRGAHVLACSVFTARSASCWTRSTWPRRTTYHQ